MDCCYSFEMEQLDFNLAHQMVKAIICRDVTDLENEFRSWICFSIIITNHLRLNEFI